MNTTVTLKTAKLLKEKGFDKPVLNCYDKCEILSSYSENIFNPKNYNTSGHVTSAPTVAEVVMWLYEKYGIWIWIEQADSTNEFEWSCKYEIGVFIKITMRKFYGSPIEAYEAAFEYILQELI